MDDNGCWSCGNLSGRVTTTAFDEDGNRIRRRKCDRCGDIWLTEERRLDKGVTWFQRAYTRVEGQKARRAKTRHTCRYCGGRYQLGTWRGHLSAPNHTAWKKRRLVELRQQRTDDSRWRYHADPVYRQHQIEAATRRARERRVA